MFTLLVSMSIFGFVMTDIGNDNPNWEYIGEMPCASGEKNSGFSFTIGKKIYFKQKNIDGSIGSICEY